VTEQRPWPPEQSANLARAIKEIVVDHRAEQRWLAALVARQDEEVR
jgi:hypothetical protein